MEKKAKPNTPMKDNNKAFERNSNKAEHHFLFARNEKRLLCLDRHEGKIDNNQRGGPLGTWE